MFPIKLRLWLHDGRKIYFNPLFVDATSTEYLLGVIVHEVLHVIFLHPLKKG